MQFLLFQLRSLLSMDTNGFAREVNGLPVVDIPGLHYFGGEELDHYLPLNVTSSFEKEIRNAVRPDLETRPTIGKTSCGVTEARRLQEYTFQVHSVNQGCNHLQRLGRQKL